MSRNRKTNDDLYDAGYVAGWAGQPCEAPVSSELDRGTWENGWRRGHARREREDKLVANEQAKATQDAEKAAAENPTLTTLAEFFTPPATPTTVAALIACLENYPGESLVELRLELHVYGLNGVELRQYVSGAPRKVYQKRELTPDDQQHGRKPTIIVKG